MRGRAYMCTMYYGRTLQHLQQGSRPERGQSPRPPQRRRDSTTKLNRLSNNIASFPQVEQWGDARLGERGPQTSSHWLSSLIYWLYGFFSLCLFPQDPCARGFVQIRTPLAKPLEGAGASCPVLGIAIVLCMGGSWFLVANAGSACTISW